LRPRLLDARRLRGLRRSRLRGRRRRLLGRRLGRRRRLLGRRRRLWARRLELLGGITLIERGRGVGILRERTGRGGEYRRKSHARHDLAKATLLHGNPPFPTVPCQVSDPAAVAPHS
jgi:hypothetical protein